MEQATVVRGVGGRPRLPDERRKRHDRCLRFDDADLRRLEALQGKWRCREAEVMRRALALAAAAEGVD